MIAWYCVYCVLLGCAVFPLIAQSPRYDIYRTPAPLTIDAKLDEPGWRQAPSAGDFHFNWWKEGAKEQTVAKLLWDDENLYVGYYCRDKNISAEVSSGRIGTKVLSTRSRRACATKPPFMACR
jgi:hypothetical protein